MDNGNYYGDIHRQQFSHKSPHNYIKPYATKAFIWFHICSMHEVVMYFTLKVYYEMRGVTDL